MKNLFYVLMLMAACGRSEAAFLYSWNAGFANSGYVPDGNTTGWSDTRTVTGLPGEITDVNVTLNIAGGYNGDLYVYLSHGSGFSVLLNRVGRTASNPFGYSDSGLTVTFNDQAAQTTDIHSYGTVNGYSISGGVEWRPDGRNVDPAAVLELDSRTATLSQFVGLNPNGSWTLFAADLSGGGVPQIESWGIEVSAVPEPVGTALVIFLLLLAVLRIARSTSLRSFLRSNGPKTRSGE